ncbi:putative transcription factor interactor and regulator CCHC(Zn) family [Medicago truncatula]|uniref:Putative transcription factor interactor and regulator CCHC(Zn) family n=1 Tax=Medicago truncatula TaxID=3880 RepID=A0A396JS09_MEDTR|nr:putative transcription factor interactor and regulator CCHC(Zn) family [Medicago truncatula]
MLPPVFKKGPGRPKKLRFRELGEGGGRFRRPGVAYRCTTCDKFGHNDRRCKENQNPAALKRKRKPAKNAIATEDDVSEADENGAAKENVIGATYATFDDDAFFDQAITNNADQLDVVVNNVVSQKTNASQSSSVSQPSNVYQPSSVSKKAKQPKAKQTKHPKQPKAMSVPKPKPAAMSVPNVSKGMSVPNPKPNPATRVKSPPLKKRCSQRLKTVKRLKNIDGPGCSVDQPMTIDNEEVAGVMTQESVAAVPAKVPVVARLGGCLNLMKSWGEISTRSTQ